MLVLGAATGGEDACYMGVPRKSLDRSGVLMKLPQRRVRVPISSPLRATDIPNADFVIVAAAGQSGLVRSTPLESTNFLAMTSTFLERSSGRIPHIAMVNDAVAGAR